MNAKGTFISFEGIDGSGKSTQVERLISSLEKASRRVVSLRDPGGSAISEQVRAILLSSDNAGMTAVTELLLYEAARAQIVGEKIIPALQEGRIVIVDRFYDSTTAYQGYGRGLNLEDVARANRIATGGLIPDLTFFIDVPWEESCRRRSRQTMDRLESEDRAFFHRIREGYLAIARQEARVRVIDGTMEAGVIAERIFHDVMNFLS